MGGGGRTGERGGHRTWPRAREAAALLGGDRPPAPRDLPLEDALGAVLGADVRALVGLPAFDASAMDGFAVAGPGPWRLVGRQLAGASSSVGLRPGEAVEIATGARVPKDTECVLPYETALVRDGTVDGPAEAGRHVRWAGEETAPGETVLTRGTLVGPAALGLAASLGHETLPVLCPRVSVLVTGEEVTTSGLPGDGSVRDSIGPMLPGVVDRAGGRVGSVRHLGDDRRALFDAVAGADGDVVAVCGSSSRGPADHLRSVLEELGATTVVDGVACRPGHPQLLAHTDRTVFVGLPGNPGAALVAAATLLVPLLAAMTGRPDPGAGLPRTVLEGRVTAHPRDTRLVAVRLDGGRAHPVGHDRPGSLRGAALADAYAVVPPDWDGAEAELLRLP
ncbi:molybdopterin molybdotransferase MoeA [Nocardiopsis halotolerans]|uniref:molybdopterin molybdotransferase MoeA n=1 Tax=Nocardiopsis halotolerans TaxID=124252 RepID=UPI000348CA57|nr:molybdopterin molybdotransferase MoeA [Nocardiopsis halotolerans]